MLSLILFLACGEKEQDSAVEEVATEETQTEVEDTATEDTGEDTAEQSDTAE